jgi:glycosyltransferase involved in cell wall biosynthesis
MDYTLNNKLAGLRSAFSDNTFISEKPEFSVIIPIFNHSTFLIDCLKSVASQKEIYFELVCVDDCSTESQVEEILGAISDLGPAITVINNIRNLGISTSQNSAVKVAKGEYLIFLDCDDYLEPNALKFVDACIKEHGRPEYIFTDRRNVNEKGEKLFDAIYGLVRSCGGINRDLIDRMIASHMKIIKRDVYLQSGGVSNRFSGIQDWELALKISNSGGRFVYLPKILYNHRHHSKSVTFTDNIGQVKKSNVLRRNYLESNLELRTSTLEQRIGLLGRLNIRDILGSASQMDAVSVFTLNKVNVRNWYCPDDIFKAYNRGDLCILEASGVQNKENIQFVRDFNSYFDLIQGDHNSFWSSTIGYLWSTDIVISPLMNVANRIQRAQHAIAGN